MREIFLTFLINVVALMNRLAGKTKVRSLANEVLKLLDGQGLTLRFRALDVCCKWPDGDGNCI